MTVTRGVVLNDHLKMLELFMFVARQYNLNLFVTMLLVVDCCSWCCFKRPFEDVGTVHVCDRSVQLESSRRTA